MYRIFCGGTKPAKTKNEVDCLSLNIDGKEKNINLKITDISRSLVTDIPDELLDLIEIAAYVYCADQKIRRGGAVLQNMGEQWVRQLHFHIPVRCLEKWQSQELYSALKECLGFLSDDNYTFDFFQKGESAGKHQDYLSFSSSKGSFSPDKICLFSGGIDSCAGAIDDIVANKQKLVLVSHHSVSKVSNVQQTLIQELQNRGHKKHIFHVPVEVNKINLEEDTVEYTQRTRSFLFASIAIITAHLFGLTKICFYENGVVSLNLPIGGDVLGARATRTTHPQALRGFERIFSLLLQKDIIIETPLQWLTKTEVVSIFRKNGFEALIGKTNSCTRPRTWTNKHTHCGVCSQCIDRRFAVLAAGLGEHDPTGQYRCDLMLGNREKGEDIVMAANFVAFAQDISGMQINALPKKYPQLFDALEHYRDDNALSKIHDMLQRHSGNVQDVIKTSFVENAGKLSLGILPQKSLLSIVAAGAKDVQLSEPKDLTQEMDAFMDKLSVAVCELVIDDDNKRVVFAGGLELTGTGYTLIKELLPNFIVAKETGIDGKAISSAKLIHAIYGYGSNDDSFRKLVSKINKKVSEKVGIDMGITFGTQDFIENIHGKGYRINGAAKLLRLVGDLKMPESTLVTN